jgi:hypothetical protein
VAQKLLEALTLLGPAFFKRCLVFPIGGDAGLLQQIERIHFIGELNGFSLHRLNSVLKFANRGVQEGEVAVGAGTNWIALGHQLEERDVWTFGFDAQRGFDLCGEAVGDGRDGGAVSPGTAEPLDGEPALIEQHEERPPLLGDVTVSSSESRSLGFEFGLGLGAALRQRGLRVEDFRHRGLLFSGGFFHVGLRCDFSALAAELLTRSRGKFVE